MHDPTDPKLPPPRSRRLPGFGRFLAATGVSLVTWGLAAFVLVPVLLRLAHGTDLPVVSGLLSGRETTPVDAYLDAWRGVSIAGTVALAMLGLASLPAWLVPSPPAAQASHTGARTAESIGVMGHALALVVASLAIATPVLARLEPVAYVLAITEDHWVEQGTFAVFLIAGFLFARAAATLRDRRAAGPALFAAGALLVALEEISWGQRIIGFRTPAALEAFNSQGEITLHNMWFPTHLFVGLGLLAFAMVLPFGERRWSGLGAFSTRVGVPTPPLYLRPAFVVTALMFVATVASNPYLKLDEVAEFSLGVVMLALGVHTLAAVGAGPELGRAIAPRLTVASLAVAGIVMTGMVRWASSTDSLIRRLNDFAANRFPAAGLSDQAIDLFDYMETREELRTPETRIEFARLLVDLGQPERADTILQAAIEDLASTEPGDAWLDAELLRTRAGVLHLLGDSSESRGLLEEALAVAETELRNADTDEDRALAHWSAAQSLDAIGRTEEALERADSACALTRDAAVRDAIRGWATSGGYPVERLRGCEERS